MLEIFRKQIKFMCNFVQHSPFVENWAHKLQVEPCDQYWEYFVNNIESISDQTFKNLLIKLSIRLKNSPTDEIMRKYFK